jgi:flavin reductase (DIM6/NTAB) family NADH-FMN oxidoreductase RutF
MRVAVSPASMEAKVVDVIPLRDLNGTAIDHWMVIGQVVAVHIHREYLTEDGRFDTGAAEAILRAGYLDGYSATTPETMFAMPRPL